MVSLSQQIEEVERELKKRAEVYPRQVSSGAMRQSIADYHVARMRAAGATLTWLRDHETDVRSNGWGQFMAYQAVVDMRFTPLLDCAGDVESWAAAGPGTIRGLNRLHGRGIEQRLTQDQALSEMRAIYKIVETETGVLMDFSDVPNILCETDKYLRVKLGEGKPRALYVAGRGY
jgi:hypothetical protein